MDTELHTLQDSIPLRIMSDYLFRELQVLDIRFFSIKNKYNTYSDKTKYSYSKCFSVGAFIPDAPRSKRRKVMHLGR